MPQVNEHEYRYYLRVSTVRPDDPLSEFTLALENAHASDLIQISLQPSECQPID